MGKEMRKHIDKFKSFSNKMTNKFDFVLGKEYSLDELPQNIKDDIERQFDGLSLSPHLSHHIVCSFI